MRRTRGTDFKQFKIAETVLREIFSRDGRRLMKRFVKISADNVGFDLIKDPLAALEYKGFMFSCPNKTHSGHLDISQGPTIKNLNDHKDQYDATNPYFVLGSLFRQ